MPENWLKRDSAGNNNRLKWYLILFMLNEINKFIKYYVKKHRNLETELNRLWWVIANSSRTNKAKEACEIEMSLRELYASPSELEKVRKYLNNDIISKKKYFRRQLEILENNFLREQYSKDLRQKIVSISSNLEKQFSEFRPNFKNKQETKSLSLGEILTTLKSEKNCQIRKKYWEAGKESGKVLKSSGFLKLIRLRNEVARRNGFDNFHTMSLQLSGHDPNMIDELFHNLDEVTRQPYKKIKTKIDEDLSKYYDISIEKIMPWHYEDLFFQEVPQCVTQNMDQFIIENPVIKVKQFYNTLGFNVENILYNSDLYERKYKNPHAFCIDINRNGDIRILANVRKSFNWTGSMLHETAHAVYFKHINKKLPYLLREPAHTFITEGIAMMFQQMIYHPSWLRLAFNLKKDTLIDIAPELEKIRKMESLIFSRWSMVMYHFEKELYKNSKVDLQELWWSLKEKYQLISMPEGRESKNDWLTKIHLITNPVYYHNYIIGQLYASQLTLTLRKKFNKSGKGLFDFTGGTNELGVPTKMSLAIGNFLKKKVFSPGRKYSWDELVVLTTGTPLAIDSFVNEYVTDFV